MPKLKQVLKNAKKEIKNFFKSADEKLDYILDNKHERVENCFKKLTEMGSKLCFTNGKEIISYDQIKDLGVNRIDVLGDNIIEYCLTALAAKGVVTCEDASSEVKNASSTAAETVAEVANKTAEVLHGETPQEHQEL